MRVIETERLALRWLEASDAGFMLELMNDPGWLRYIGDRGIRSVADARKYIEDGPREMYARLGVGLYMVELREGGAALGICGLVQRDWLEDVDLGFAFLPQFRGKGYAYEAAAATLDFGRSTLHLRRIAAIVAPENRDSMRLLEKLGFRLERMATPPLETRAVCVMALPLDTTAMRADGS